MRVSAVFTSRGGSRRRRRRRPALRRCRSNDVCCLARSGNKFLRECRADGWSARVIPHLRAEWIFLWQYVLHIPLDACLTSHHLASDYGLVATYLLRLTLFSPVILAAIGADAATVRGLLMPCVPVQNLVYVTVQACGGYTGPVGSLGHSQHGGRSRADRLRRGRD